MEPELRAEKLLIAESADVAPRTRREPGFSVSFRTRGDGRGRPSLLPGYWFSICFALRLGLGASGAGWLRRDCDGLAVGGVAGQDGGLGPVEIPSVGDGDYGIGAGITACMVKLPSRSL